LILKPNKKRDGYIFQANPRRQAKRPAGRIDSIRADTSALEKKIDEMVYKLYNLTPEEVEIVEGK
jgi:hypothetical protein